MNWIILLYIAVGFIRVGYDFFQPYHNQPGYIARRNWIMIAFYIFFWPFLLVISGDIHYFKIWIKRKFNKGS